MSRQYLRIHIEALEAARSPAQMAVIVGLYRLADAQRWQPFPASDRWLCARLRSSKSVVRRALQILQALDLLVVLRSGDRETARIISILEPGSATTSRTTSQTTSRTTFSNREGAGNVQNQRPNFEVVPPNEPPHEPPLGPNYHILSTSKPDQSNPQRERKQIQGSSLGQIQTQPDSLSVRFSDLIVRVWREADGGHAVTADQPRAALDYAEANPKVAERLCADESLLGEVIAQHIENAKPSYQNLGALLRFDRISPILSEMGSEKTKTADRWSRHERQNRKWR